MLWGEKHLYNVKTVSDVLIGISDVVAYSMKESLSALSFATSLSSYVVKIFAERSKRN